MTTDNFQYPDKKRVLLPLGLSALVHFALFVVLVLIPPPLLDPPEPESSPENTEFEIETLVEENQDKFQEIAEKPLPEPKIAEVPPEPPKPPEPVSNVYKKPVVQETNEERPTEAEYVSDQDNKVDEDTRAEVTTTSDVAPGKTAPEKAEEKPELARLEEQKAQEETVRPPSELVEESPEHKHEELNEESPIVRKKIDPRRLFQPSVADYNKVFGAQDQQKREYVKARAGARKPKLFADHEERSEALRASIENFITEVKPGNHTGVNAHRNVYATYINKMHRGIHPRWADGYLMYLDTRVSQGDPLADPGLNVTLEFVIRAADGKVESINIVKSSGQLQFDAEAISIGLAIGPQPDPPRDIVSTNGKVYIHWEFWRNQRQCGPFGASVFLVHTDKG